MATPIFSTGYDDLRFTQITWLLSQLEGKADGNTGLGQPDDTTTPLLEELTWLANLFVRNHEVVAVMPHPDGQCPGSNEHQRKGIEGTCYIALNPHRRVPTLGYQ